MHINHFWIEDRGRAMQGLWVEVKKTKQEKNSWTPKMRRDFLFSALLLLQPGCWRTRLNPDLSACSMRKWLGRLTTRRGAAEFFFCFFGTAPHTKTAVLCLADSLSGCLPTIGPRVWVSVPKKNRISSSSKSKWPRCVSQHRSLMRRMAPSPINLATLHWPCGWSADA